MKMLLLSASVPWLLTTPCVAADSTTKSIFCMNQDDGTPCGQNEVCMSGFCTPMTTLDRTLADKISCSNATKNADSSWNVKDLAVPGLSVGDVADVKSHSVIIGGADLFDALNIKCGAEK